MNIGLTKIGANLNMPIEQIVLIIVVLGGMLFFAKDFKLGVIMELILTSLVFMGTYALGLNYAPSLIVFFMWLVILSLTFYAMEKTTARGAII